MSDNLVALLVEHRKEQHKLIFSLGRNFAYSEMVFISNLGTTANIYTDVLDSTRRKTAEVIQLKMAR